MRPTLPSLLLLAAAIASAQNPAPKATPPAPATTSLPVTSVSLYKNGVGFFQHSGRITGNASVTIDFTSGQLNDVLQSLTAVDLNGGRIAGAGYNSTTPLDQQLKNLPLALSADPTALDFYNALRGARLQVTGSGAPITGRLLSVEARNATTTDGKQPAPERDLLTLVSDTGDTRTLELTPATTVRLLDTALHTDVTRYLQLLDANRSQGLRHLTLTDNGIGTRDLRLSYISEVPVWKSTYRILFNDNAPSAASSQTATLQGWSVVDNTTGEDWINVHLSLIAGAPQSFIQPLSQPIYSRRPEVPIAQEAQLTPQTFDSAIDGPSAPGGVFGGNGTGVPAPRSMMALKSGTGNGQGVGIGAGYAANIGRGSVNALHGRAEPVAGMAETAIDGNGAVDSFAPNTTTAAFDDYFAYNLTEPVTILKNQSALVPILQARVQAERVTLASYLSPWQTSQPLRALWLTNTSGLTLDRGSFSLVEDGNFGGEGLLEPIHPGEKRLLSYAADQAVHITSQDNSAGLHRPTLTFSASKGVLHIQRTQLDSVTYLIHNSAPDTRTVVLEYPVNTAMTLDPSTPQPDETTAKVYRFRLSVAPGETASLPVNSRGTVSSVWQLTGENQLNAIFQNNNNDPALVAALQPIVQARRRVAEAQTAVDQTNQHLTTLHSDEDRQRANITALANADKSSRDRFVHDLNATEDAIATTQHELNTRTADLDAAKAALANQIQSLQITTP